MEKQKNTQLFIIAVLSVVLLTMSVGFAAFSRTLNINGNVVATAAKWEIAFDKDSYAETTDSVEATTSINATDMTYNVTLAPDEFYEFTINIKNTGTFDAVLKTLTMSGLTEDQAKYLEYTVTYGNTSYTSSNNSLSVALNKNSQAAVKVRVKYKLPSDYADLPSTNQNITLTASFGFEQAA